VQRFSRQGTNDKYNCTVMFHGPNGVGTFRAYVVTVNGDSINYKERCR
jgi:hypothetical protein